MITTAYRPDIDGLRAIAVTAVVVYHAFPELLPGGFVGVDVFFVISGFLISGIIFDDMESRRFSLARFYARRVRRIFPALVVVVCATIVASWFILLPAAFEHFGRQVIASSLFAANFFFWLQSGYFSPDAASFPLLHLWSLGVEEQYYIVWPLLVVLLARPSRWAAVILLLGVASFALSVLLADHRELDFYLPVTRAWELMAGAALAWFDRRAPLRSVQAPNLLVAVGLALIATSALLLDAKSDFPSWRAAFPVVGSMLVIAAGGSSRFAAYVLSNRSAVFTGLISYPLYLWHWPILVLAASAKFLPLTLLERSAAIVAAYALAAATFWYIERPIRGRHLARWQIASFAICLAATAGIGGAIVKWNGFGGRFPPDILPASNATRIPAWRVDTCLLDLASQTKFADTCIEPVRPLVLIWGDSTAGALMPGLRDLQSRTSFGIGQLTANGCQPLLSTAVSPACRSNNERVLELIARVQPDIVLLLGFGPLDDTTKEGWGATVKALKNVPRVVVVGPAPLWKRGLPEQFTSYYITHRRRLPERSQSQVKNLWNDLSARQFFQEHHAEYVSAWAIFCTVDGCLTRIGERDMTAVDEVHLSESGSIFLINSIAAQIGAVR
ncbi:acyltransferase family protein [Bradyrhizobium sp. CCBAU 51753]|uniref:acyltransferase family protein n=1 Tax=Bradyrhizobium sp. CCBAU 51753 TaxID=1325100 RepID=UPI00188C5C4A|nr:acyltransferase family protein [Bradyrhizobium sp. CCBAU 51753]